MSKTTKDNIKFFCGFIPIICWIIMVIALCNYQDYRNENTQEYIGVQYEVSIVDHDGNVLYEEDGWANGKFQYYNGEIWLTDENNDQIMIEGAID